MAAAALLTSPALLSAVQEEEHADAGGASLFTPDLGLSVWTIVVFLVVLFVLGKYAWKPMLAALDAREQGIVGSIASASQMREEAEKLLEEHRRQLADARRQAQEIVASGREAGETLRKDIEAKAREEGDRMLERARVEIHRERDQAMDTLRKESVDLALTVASKILHEKLDGPADRALVEEYLAEVGRPAAEA